MTKLVRLTLCCISISWLIGCATSDYRPVKADFSTRVRAGEQSFATSKGKDYERGLGPLLQAAMRECLPPGAPPYRGQFTLVADVLVSGEVVSAVVRPENNVTACFAKRIGEATLPTPPLASQASRFPIEITVEIVP